MLSVRSVSSFVQPITRVPLAAGAEVSASRRASHRPNDQRVQVLLEMMLKTTSQACNHHVSPT